LYGDQGHKKSLGLIKNALTPITKPGLWRRLCEEKEGPSNQKVETHFQDKLNTCGNLGRGKRRKTNERGNPVFRMVMRVLAKGEVTFGMQRSRQT